MRRRRRNVTTMMDLVYRFAELFNWSFAFGTRTADVWIHLGVLWEVGGYFVVFFGAVFDEVGNCTELAGAYGLIDLAF